MSEWKEIRRIIDSCLDTLYSNDARLFDRNKGRGICERALVFRFAHHLQNELEKNKLDYFVDCDFNSSEYLDNIGRKKSKHGKPIHNQKGVEIKRFIDIIVHKRNADSEGNFVCFEIKKWNNKTTEGLKKDQNNLQVLTSRYGYQYGFHIILGKTIDRTTFETFGRGGTERLPTWEAFRNG